MMTQELNVCALAAIDRRALSQAWYSALHCASGVKTGVPERQRTRSAASDREITAARSSREHAYAEGLARNGARSENVKTRPSGGGAENDRRARRTPLARRIERKFLYPRPAAQRATFVAGGKRVHVVLQTSPGLVRLVAVCPPAIRETVARALAQARFALASRGVACS